MPFPKNCGHEGPETRLCIQDDEVSSLHRKIELQSFRTEACNRGLKRLGDLLAETKSELTELRHAATRCVCGLFSLRLKVFWSCFPLDFS